MNEKEATTLLSELSANQFLNPNLVIIEKRDLDKHRLQIRGDYNRQSIVALLRKKRLSFDVSNGYLTVFKP
jgi:hypothetical protein